MYSIGDKNPPVVIPNRFIPQCPTAFITNESIGFIEQYEAIRIAKEATGSPYFRSVGEADTKLVQALIVLEQERTYTDSAINAALSKS